MRLITGVVGCLAALVMGAHPARSLELTGALLYKITIDGRLGPFWATTSGSDARPLGIAETGAHGSLENVYEGEIDKELLPGSHIIAAFWQCLSGEWPLAGMILNLYFNRDNLRPGISVVIPGTRSFTQFQPNTAATTFSLYLREVQNEGASSYDDGSWHARLGVAFYFPAWGFTDRWRPSDFYEIDRVGMKWYQHDGLPDGVLIFELVVEPAVAPTPANSGAAPSGRVGYPAVVPPLVASVGGDQWPAPPTSAFRGTPVPGNPTPMAGGTERATEEPADALTPAPTPEAQVTASAPASPGTPDAGTTQTPAPPAAAAAAPTLTDGARITPTGPRPRSTLTPSGSPPPARAPTPRVTPRHQHRHTGSTSWWDRLMEVFRG